MSDSPAPLDVALCWHMHQPDYRGPDRSDFQLPWVYLHGIKDYTDMASHLEAEPQARATVNFGPVLLEQIDDYVVQIDAWLQRGERIRDRLLRGLAGPGLPADDASRLELIRDCLRANEHHLIGRFAMFSELAETARGIDARPLTLPYFSDQYLSDLLVWYHLAWMGEFPRAHSLIIGLEKKERNFSPDDRQRLVALIGDLLRGIVPRYKALAASGRVELTVSPYAHPIVPLLLDLQSTRDAMPDAVLPAADHYPGGEARARWHVRKGIEVFEKHFGHRPAGCWPSEGGVSAAALRILEEEGFRWAASGQTVLQHSLSTAEAEPPANYTYAPYRVHDNALTCFFRDDGLSDLIGFTFSDWHADDAVDNLIEHLERIDDATVAQPNRIVPIIMDGENAWEYYPRNGWYFLRTLYARLGEHPRLRLTTFSDFLDRRTAPGASLSRLVAGSWVYGTFSTWIGDRDKNRAWDMLIEAKHVFDRVMAADALDPQRRAEAELQLATCEGSDWFWWFGDYNPGPVVSEFEKLFRRQLTQLYKLLGETPPADLEQPFVQGAGTPDRGGVMRRN